VSITTLIPAFKVQYFRELLISLRGQLVKPGRVIISDDSKNNDFIRAAEDKKYHDLIRNLNIEVIEGPKRGHYANIQQLVRKLSGGDNFFHVLCDDDIIYPEFYKQHLESHSSSEALCSFSRRWIALESGQPVSVAAYPPVVTSSGEKSLLVDADHLFQSILPNCNNWLGEFSNTVFKKEADTFFLEPKFCGIHHYGLYDLGIYLRCARRHGGLFVNDYLGAFRRSSTQHSSQTKSPTFRSSCVAWIAVSIAAYQDGKITKEQMFSCGKIVFTLLRMHFSNDPEAAKVLALETLVRQKNTKSYIRDFLAVWPLFLKHIDPALL
jgi:hypothetical protein